MTTPPSPHDDPAENVPQAAEPGHEAPDRAPDHDAAATLASPAEAAVLAAGFAVTSREMPQLLRLVRRRMPADRDAVAEALSEVRRRGWAARLLDAANRTGRFWITAADARNAAEVVHDPEASAEVLEAALRPVLQARLQAAGAGPAAALESLATEAADVAGAPLSAERHGALARAVAEAHGLDPEEADRFLSRAASEEAARREERRAAARAARELRRDEVARLRAWEQSLVPFEEVAERLGATAKEALRWVGAGLVPVARRIPGKRERWEFDPATLDALRAEVPAWREAEADAAPARARGDGRDRPVPLVGGRAANAAVARVAALDRYAGHFATARALNRRLTLVTGPTNSGKSHLALDRLSTAESGVALAPLRLLAHEFREALAARGVLASLSTGEERITVEGSRHLAATVEMCPLNRPVDVAIVDEAQLLYDRDRGAAWTAAIMGVPARDVFILGAPDCIPMVRRIAALCGDPLEEISLERKSPLRAATEPVGLGDLRAGDALVAFSRRDVLDLRAELVRRGRRVAVVYGALSPEVRRAEAARFRSGEAEVLVATDAIGMGLNLPIRRVVFSAGWKFDGEVRRELTAQEIKQIGGRAGRFGAFEDGIVAVLAGSGASPDTIRRALAAPPEVMDELRPQVQPDSEIIRAVAAEIGSDSLFGVLARIKRAVLRRDDPNYRLGDMEQQMAVATAVDGVAGLSLLDRWTYALCPVSERDNGVARLARWAVEHGAGRPVVPPHAGRLPSPERAQREELEHAEKVHRRLVAWRWLSLRFEAAYPNRAEAEAETERLDSWIEEVLRTQRQGRDGAVGLGLTRSARGRPGGGTPEGGGAPAAGERESRGRGGMRGGPPRRGWAGRGADAVADGAEARPDVGASRRSRRGQAAAPPAVPRRGRAGGGAGAGKPSRSKGGPGRRSPNR
ncbi:helicase-related protein [Roseomonas elaeocarpi]|uniref:Helicase-related protein n=1 Tax=Roseomonas elaeocarpi TaxID=907779 RepID=A0ABV6K201_9PROT